MVKIIRNLLNGIGIGRHKADLGDAPTSCERDRASEANNVIPCIGELPLSVLPGQSMSPLGRAGRLEEAQKLQNIIMRQLADNASMMVTPQTMCSSNPPPNLNLKPGQMTQVRNKTATEVAAQMQLAQASMATVSNMAVRSMQIKNLLNELLPEVCREHVYKCDHEHSLVDNCEIVKWTFYNDLAVRLKVEADWVLDGGDPSPLIEDFELWQADAIMKCEAGDDVWPRPKPSASSGSTSGQMGASQANAQQLSGLMNANNAGMMNQAALGNALGSALGLGGLFK